MRCEAYLDDVSDTGPEDLTLRILRSIDQRLEWLEKTTAHGLRDDGRANERRGVTHPRH